MNIAIAAVAQMIGRITVLLAIVLLVWRFADEIGQAEDSGRIVQQFGPNAYVSALASSASLAVSGMFAIALGTMLERFNNDD